MQIHVEDFFGYSEKVDSFKRDQIDLNSIEPGDLFRNEEVL